MEHVPFRRGTVAPETVAPEQDRRPRLSPGEDRLLAALFSLYRYTLSPVFAASGLGHCRYLPSCSEYAYVAIARHGWLRGTALALGRLSRCHPWAAGGLDPVAPAPPSRGTGPKGPHPDHLP